MNETVQEKIINLLRAEKRISEQLVEDSDIDMMVDNLECVRNDQDYEWMSNKVLPEFPAIMWTEAAGWANQYFQTRDFVDARIETNDPRAEQKQSAVKCCLNKTLNMREVYFYQKYIRARSINFLWGKVMGYAWWERKEVDDDRDPQNPRKRIIYDRFNFDVLDPRNVFVSPDYVYSPQENAWVILRFEKSYEQLKEDEEKCSYFNLDKVKEAMKSPGETETSQKTYNKNGPAVNSEPMEPTKLMDVYVRFGKAWMVPKTYNEYGEILEADVGYDDEGEVKSDAILIEAVLTYVKPAANEILIRYQPTPWYDARNQAYRPLFRGLCYPHPTKPDAIGDGTYLHEINSTINDTFNMGMDRQTLALFPTMKGKKYSLVDNDTIRWEPGHVMELEDPKDIEEIQIEDKMDNAIMTINFLTGYMDKVSATFPTTMGQMPQQASTSATAIAGAEQRTNARSQFKNLTFEYTWGVDFYWMILQMTARFMHEATAVRMFGDLIAAFDPIPEYTYTPVPSNVELEYNKNTLMRTVDQMMGRVANIPNPNTPKLLNYLLSRVFELNANLFPGYKNALLDERPPAINPETGEPIPGSQGMGGPPNPSGKGGPPPDMNSGTSSQAGIPQSPQEMAVRSAMGGE